jgi:hypothetical protein
MGEIVNKKDSINRSATAVALISALVVGCNGYHQFYSGPKMAAPEIAELYSDLVLDNIRLQSINNINGPNGPYFGYSSRWDASFHVDLLPGTYTLDIGVHGGALESLSNLQCTFEAKAGAIYLLRASLMNRVWRVWIVEKRSGQVVGENRTFFNLVGPGALH